jgi:2-dehydropantoate 2-reductase
MGEIDLPSKPRVAVVGAGAVGAYYGAMLAHGGHDVHFLFHSDVDTVRANGLRIESYKGNFRIPASQLRAYSDVSKMPKADLVIVGLKATSNHLFRTLIPPLLHDGTAILTMQNGLGNEEDLADLFGSERVMGAMAFTCNNRLAPGVISHTAEGWIRLGEHDRATGPRARRLGQMFNDSGVECTVVDNLKHGRWEKILWNVPFNGLGALLSATTDVLLSTPDAEALVISLMQEALAAAASLGLHYPPDWVPDKIALTRRVGAYKTSMQIDREQGRPMEIEAIVGRPVKIAQQHGVPVPRMEMLYRMLCLIVKNDR